MLPAFAKTGKSAATIPAPVAAAKGTSIAACTELRHPNPYCRSGAPAAIHTRQNSKSISYTYVRSNTNLLINATNTALANSK